MSTTIDRVRPPSPAVSAATWHLFGLIGVTAAAWMTGAALALGRSYPTKAALIFAVIAALVVGAIRAGHPHPRFGPGNGLTMLRAAIVSLVSALAFERVDASVATLVVLASLAALILDGGDGWVARRTGMTSRFGARFDMEIDALLILVLSIMAWRHGKAGAWVMLAGLFRYAFVAASWLWPWLMTALPPSRRRQTICVVQIIALVIVVSPVVAPTSSVAVAAIALALLTWSFLVDVVWLARQK